MHARGSALCTGFALLSLFSRAARAQRSASADEGSTVVRAGPRRTVEDGPRAATVVDLDRRGRDSATITALLDEAPGLHTRSTGDALAASYVSLRGAPSTQVTIAVDGVVLNEALGLSVDLSSLPPAAFARAEVYRGASPLYLGLQGLGGAIDLRTREPSRSGVAWVTAGGGSFLQRRASAFVAGGAFARAMVLLSYRGTQGNFFFYDDNATPLDPRDDRTDRVRRNAWANAIDGLLRLCVGPVCLQALADARLAGLPGPGSLQYQRTSIAQGRWLARLSATLRRGEHRFEPYASVQWRRDGFADPALEAGAGDAQSVGSVVEGGARVTLREDRARAEGVARVRHERFDTSDGGGGAGAARASRTSALVGVELFATITSGLTWMGGFGFEAMDDRSSVAQRSRALASPRLSLRYEPWPWLALRASGALLERAPTLVELFGIGEFLRGNAALESEQSASVDGAVVLQGARGWARGRLELGAFARRAENLIVLTRTSALALKAFNLRGAEVLGFEAHGRLSLGRHFDLTASYAYTSARATGFGDVDRRRVPNIPEHDAYVRAEGRWRWLRASAELSAIAGLFFDSANLEAAPPRALVGASMGVDLPWVRGLAIDASASNLLDVRDGIVSRPSGRSERVAASDFAGFPLPSRGVYVSVSWNSDAR